MNNGIFSAYNTRYDFSVYPVINLTVDTDNFSLPKNYDIIRLTSSSVVTITGLVGIKDKIFTLFNVGSYDIRIANLSSFSISTNKILVSNNSDVILSPNESITLFYDDSNKLWRTAGVIKAYNPTDFTFVNVYDFTRTSAPNTATGSSGSWSWLIPSSAKYLEFILIGGGGGGGSGRRGAAGSARSGGGGGGGAGLNIYKVNTVDLSTYALSIAVGAGGAGGAAVTTNDTNGNGGSLGGASTITSGSISWIAFNGGGSAGGGGTTSTGTAGQGAQPGTNNASLYNGSDGGAGSTGAGGSSVPGGASTAGNMKGGGGGGGADAGNNSGAGGVGAAHCTYLFVGALSGSVGSANNAGGAAGGAGNGGNGTDATTTAGILSAGGGGGGGGGGAYGSGGNGGSGSYGGGGGGGGGSLNGSNSGAGGNGGSGYVRIIVWS